jgi:hypothetical protein
MTEPISSSSAEFLERLQREYRSVTAGGADDPEAYLDLLRDRLDDLSSAGRADSDEGRALSSFLADFEPPAVDDDE